MSTYAAILLALVTVRFLPRAHTKQRRGALLGVAGACLLVGLAAGPHSAPVLVKVAGLLLMPLGLLLVLLLVLSYVAWWRERPGWAAAIFGIHVFVLAIGNPALSAAGQRYVEGRYAELDPFSEAPFDAVIVLGGGTSATPTGRPQLGMSGDRVVVGARLYHRGLTPILVASGSPIPGFAEHDSADAATRIWRELGVPAHAILRVDGARTTAEEARLHGALIRSSGWRRVGMVTSAFHMTRAIERFAAEDVEVVPLPADVRGTSVAHEGFVSLLPRASAAQMNQTVMWELAGRLAGR